MSKEAGKSALKILTVDDDANLLELLTLQLQEAGYEVTTAESGEQALAHLGVARPDLVITDLSMGGLDGMALFEAIHQTQPTLPVMVLTGHGTIADAVAATRRGMVGYLTKPFDAATLLSNVKSALAAGVAASVKREAGTDEWRAGIITRSPAMEEVLARALQVAATDASVLIYGESGTGKELLARAIHAASERRKCAFVAINCGAMPEQLLTSVSFLRPTAR